VCFIQKIVELDMACKLASPLAIRRMTPKESKDFVLDVEDGKKWRERNGLFQLLKKNMEEFCCSTSLHGLQYVGEKQRHTSERYVC
jgi:hypothetical protein